MVIEFRRSRRWWPDVPVASSAKAGIRNPGSLPASLMYFCSSQPKVCL
jgi:hypothetical protein